MAETLMFRVASMMHQSRLYSHNKAITSATERLASGSRINSAKDDPFRNHETNNVNSKIRCLEKAKQNSKDGASLMQIAEGTCGEIESILQRVRELSVQSANDTLSSTERWFLNDEAQGLLQEVERIAAGTTFNSKLVFGDSLFGNEVQDSFSGENRDLKDWQPFTHGGRAGVLHIGPGTDKQDEVKISIPELSIKTMGLDTLSITYQNGASKAIDDLDSTINSLHLVRSYMGSVVNRMDTQTERIEEEDISLNDYTGKIRDADYAKESTEFVSAQILQQSAISVLAQSNARVNKVLEMFG